MTRAELQEGANVNQTGPWRILATIGQWEYWTADDGFDSAHANVYRRRASVFNYQAYDGTPVGARWECKRAHFDRFIAS